MTEIVRANASHIPAIHAIEAECFSQPWSENSLMSEMNNGRSAMFVAADNGEVVGWAGLEAVFGEGSVTNIAVTERLRGRGIGRRLTEALIEESRRQSLDTLTLEVRASNTAAITLYESLGFVKIGVRPRFYDFPREDAVMMQMTLL